MHLLAEKDAFKATEHFNMISGTSIGSVNAFCAASDNIETNFGLLKELFSSASSNIFPGSPATIFLRSVFRRGPLFSSEVLKEIAIKLTKDKRLSDLQTDFVCTTSSLSGFQARTMTNFKGDTYQNTLAIDAILASCAAPLYFRPHHIKNVTQEFLDGGVWANNPILVSILAANRQKGVPFSAMKIVSIGTGLVRQGTTATDINALRPASFGAIQMMAEIYNATQMDAALAAASQLVGAENITHINPTLREPIALHDAEKALAQLPQYAEEAYKEYRAEVMAIPKLSDFFTAGHHDERTLASSEMIQVSGLSRIIPKRKYYGQFRDGGGNIEDYLRTARQSIKMISINMITGLTFEDIKRVFEEKLRAIDNFQITISLINPDRDDLMRVVSASISDDYATSAENLSVQIQATIERLRIFRDSLAKREASRFDLRVHNTFPFASAIMLDSETSRGKIQLETKPYKATLTDSFAFELVNVGPDGLFTTLRKAYNDLIADGQTVSG